MLDENFLIAVIIALVGGFFTVVIANRLGGQWERMVHKLSHQWVQWPQRIFMAFGIFIFVMVAINFYYARTYNTNVFVVISELPFFQSVPEPIRWFFGQLGAEFGVLLDILREAPQRTPLMLILTIVFLLYILMALFGAKWTQKLMMITAVLLILIFLFNDHFKNFESDSDSPFNSYYLPDEDPATAPNPLYIPG